jgi:autotransporter-associated beta strand protein
VPALLLSLLPGVCVQILPFALLAGVTVYTAAPAPAQTVIQGNLQPDTYYSYRDFGGKVSASGTILSYYSFTGQNATNSLLEYTNLTYANLSFVNLTGVLFTAANLSNANLQNANLTSAFLGGADLTGADLRNTGVGRISNIQLRQAGSIRGVNVSGNQMTYFQLNQEDLTGANLSGVNMYAGNLSDSNLTNANLTGVVLQDGNLTGANLTGANLTGADLRNTKILAQQLVAASGITGINLSGNFMNNSALGGENLTDANLSGVTMQLSDLSYANLTRANLSNANLLQTNLTGANLHLAILPYYLPTLPIISGATVNVVSELTTTSLGNTTIDTGGTLNVSSTLTLNSMFSVTGTLNASGANITTGALSGSGKIALGTGGLALVLNQSSEPQWQNSEFRGIISGTGGLTKGGAGDLALYATNTYTGGTTLNGGRLLIGNNAALGTGTLTITGGHIRAHQAARTLTNPLALNGSFEVGQLTTFTGNATLGANVTITATDATNSSVFSGRISGLGFALIKAGPGTLTLSGNNTYTGVTVVRAGTLRITGTSQTSGLTVDGGTLDLASLVAPSLSVGSLSGTGGTVALGAKTLAVNEGISTEYRGTINGAGGSVTKTGASILALYGTNTYTGGTTLNGGGLLIGNNAALGTGPLTINGGYIGADGAARTLGNTLALNGSFALGASTFFTGNATLGANVTVTATGAVVDESRLSGGVSGNGFALTKAGAGVLTLSGNNTYTGGTTVSEGTLIAANSNALGTGGVTVNGSLSANGNGRLDLASSLSVSSLAGTTGGTVGLRANTLTVNQATNTAYRGTIGGTGGSLTKNGAGDLALYGTNTYTGGTRLNAGRLLIGNNAALGTGTLTINGGHVRAHDAPRTVGNALALNGSFEVGQSTTFTGNATLGTNVTVTTNETEGAVVMSGVIGGIGFGITKAGAGALTLSGNNTYTGATTVNGGTLTLTGTSQTSGYSVASGATLSRNGSTLAVNSGQSFGGDGTVLGNLTFGAGSVLSPGSGGIGGLAVTGWVSLDPGAFFDIDLGLNGLSDTVSADIFAFASAGNYTVRFFDGTAGNVLTEGDVVGKQFRVARASVGGFNYNPATHNILTQGTGEVGAIGGNWSVVREGNSDYLTFSATTFQPVPAPPAAVSLAIGGMVGLVGTGLGRLRTRKSRETETAA